MCKLFYMHIYIYVYIHECDTRMTVWPILLWCIAKFWNKFTSLFISDSLWGWNICHWPGSNTAILSLLSVTMKTLAIDTNIATDSIIGRICCLFCIEFWSGDSLQKHRVKGHLPILFFLSMTNQIKIVSYRLSKMILRWNLYTEK